MPPRFCPLGFAKFYVNKNSAEAGSGAHCVEHACAIWDKNYGQCGLMTAIESLGTLADSSASIPTREFMGVSKEPVSTKVSKGVSSIFDKLRGKKLPSAEKKPKDPSNIPTVTPTPVTETAAVPVTTKVEEAPSIPAANNNPEIVNPAVARVGSSIAAAADPSRKTPVTPVTPVVQKSVLATPVTPVKPVTSEPPIPVVAEPPIPVVAELIPVPVEPDTPVIEEPAPVTSIEVQVETYAPPPPPPPPAPVPTQNVNIDSVIDAAAEQLSKITDFDDFSDLLNPPSIPVSDLPIISKPDDDDEDDEVGDDGR